MSANFFALAATLCFALASVGFTHYAKKLSPLWMNAFKASVAFICFFVAFVATKDFSHVPRAESLMAFFISGVVGLNIADIFLLKSFTRIGSARTLMIFSFQPIILGTLAYIIFSQVLSTQKILAIVFLIGCVLSMSYERFKKDGHWEMQGPLYAFLGVVLDSCGIMLTRFAFDSDPQIHVMEGNFYRCVGAISGFLLMAAVKPFKLVKTFKSISQKNQSLVVGVAALGTFLSLSLYLHALRTGQLAVITAIVGTGPLLATVLECAFQKRWPSRYLYLSLVFFGLGFYLLL